MIWVSSGCKHRILSGFTLKSGQTERHRNQFSHLEARRGDEWRCDKAALWACRGERQEVGAVTRVCSAAGGRQRTESWFFFTPEFRPVVPCRLHAARRLSVCNTLANKRLVVRSLFQTEKCIDKPVCWLKSFLTRSSWVALTVTDRTLLAKWSASDPTLINVSLSRPLKLTESNPSVYYKMPGSITTMTPMFSVSEPPLHQQTLSKFNNTTDSFLYTQIYTVSVSVYRWFIVSVWKQ